MLKYLVSYHRFIFTLIFIAFLYLSFSFFFTKSNDKCFQSFSLKSMGYIPIEISTKGLNRKTFNDQIDLIKKQINDISTKINARDKRSLINRINSSTSPFPLPNSIFDLLKKAKEVNIITHGYFDITIKPLMTLWRDHAKKNKEPPEILINEIKKIIGCNKFELIENSKSITLKKNSQLDLGGIAKGWLADLIVHRLKEHGARRILVNIGGDMTFWDQNPNSKFKIGIEHPQRKDTLFTTLTLSNGSLATSGNHYRFFEIDNKRYSHIINPKTGKPVANHILSVTAYSQKGYISDAMATAILILGSKKGLELVETLQGVECLIITKNQNSSGNSSLSTILSSGLRNNATFVAAVRS